MVQNIINITPLSLISNSSEFIGSLSKILLCDKIIIQIYTVLYDILFKSFQFYVNKKASVIGGFLIYKTYCFFLSH